VLEITRYGICISIIVSIDKQSHPIAYLRPIRAWQIIEVVHPRSIYHHRRQTLWIRAAWKLERNRTRSHLQPSVAGLLLNRLIADTIPIAPNSSTTPKVNRIRFTVILLSNQQNLKARFWIKLLLPICGCILYYHQLRVNNQIIVYQAIRATSNHWFRTPVFAGIFGFYILTHISQTLIRDQRGSLTNVKFSTKGSGFSRYSFLTMARFGQLYTNHPSTSFMHGIYSSKKLFASPLLPSLSID